MPRNSENLRGSAQLETMAEQLFNGVVEDSSLAPVLSVAAPYVKNLLTQAADEFAGAPISAIPNERMNDRRMLQGIRQDYISNTGGVVADVAEEHAQRTAEGVFRAFGYEGEALEDVMNTGTGHAVKFAARMTDPTAAGTVAINKAIARRTPLIDYTADEENPAETRARVSSMSSELAKGIYEDVYKHGDYGSLSFSEVGDVASEVIGQGGLDSGSSDQGTRIDSFREKLRGYGKTVESLKNVMDGDVKELISQMDAMSGGSTMATGITGLKDTAKRMEHMALATGISGGEHGQAFRTMVENFYSDRNGGGMASIGGTEAMAREAAMHYSYSLANGRRSYGVSQEQLEQGFSAFATNTAATGKNRVIAAAYDTFLLSRGGGDTEENRRAFQEEANGDYSAGRMHEMIKKYDTSGGSLADRINNPFIQEMAESSFIQGIANSEADNELMNIAQQAPERIAKITGKSVEEMREAGVDLSAPLDQVRRQLQDRGMLNAKQSKALEDYSMEVAAEVSARSGVDSKTAWSMVSSAQRGDALRNQEIEEGGGINLPGGGLESMTAIVQRKQNPNIADIVTAGTKGVDLDYYTEAMQQYTALPERVTESPQQQQQQQQPQLNQSTAAMQEKTIEGYSKPASSVGFEQIQKTLEEILIVLRNK